VGWEISPHDGGAHFLPEPPNEVLCAQCGSLLDPDFLPRSIRKSKYELSSTYDNRVIVGRAAYDVLTAAGCDHRDFLLLPCRAPQFLFRPRRILAFDTEAAGTRFGPPCQACGNFVHVTGISPCAVREVVGSLAPGAYRSDLGFGSGPEKSPLIFLSFGVGEALMRSRLRLFDLHPVCASRHAES
jgi:hypothetical protein